MTVNELIAELQILVAQGHGELDVRLENSEDISKIICYPARATEARLTAWDSSIPPYILLREPKPLPQSFE